MEMESSTKSDVKMIRITSYFKVRYLQIFMLFFVEASCYAMRSNLNVVLARIVTTNVTEVLNGTSINRRHFNWSLSQQGILLSSFYLFYTVSQVFGGLVSFKFGGKRVILMSTLGTAIFTILSPMSIHFGGYYLFTVIRSTKGFLEGLFYPSKMQFLSKWVPRMERTRMISICSSGSALGAISSILFSDLIASEFSWEATFYIFGTLGVIWGVAFALLVSETPEDCSLIKLEEIDHIRFSRQRALNSQSNLGDFPVKEMLKSKPLWTIIFGMFTVNYTYYFMLEDLPAYLVQKFSLHAKFSGIILTLPYASSSAMMLATGQLSDSLRQKYSMKITNIRKSAYIIGFIGQTAFFLAILFSHDYTSSAVFLIFSMSFSGITLPTFDSNLLDLSPTYVSFSMLFINSIGAFGSFTSPVMTGMITSGDFENWRYAFIVPSSLNILSSIFVYQFCSGDIQEWDDYGYV